MTFVRSFVGFRPPRRYDGLPFTKLKIKESATEDGTYATLETINLSPLDADPSKPTTRNFTTALATLDPAWYIIRWEDAQQSAFESDPLYFEGLTSDLTTVDAVRAFLQKGSTDDAQDSILSSLIARASSTITRYCEREFVPSDATTRTFYLQSGRAGGAMYLSLAPYDLRTVTSIQIDTDETSPTTLQAVEYRLTPKPAPDGVYTGVKFALLSMGRGIWPQREIAITGDWGFSSVPRDVEDACIKTVAVWLRRDVAAFDQTAADGVWIRPLELPSTVTATLDRYRRAQVA